MKKHCIRLNPGEEKMGDIRQRSVALQPKKKPDAKHATVQDWRAFCEYVRRVTIEFAHAIDTAKNKVETGSAECHGGDM